MNCVKTFENSSVRKIFEKNMVKRIAFFAMFFRFLAATNRIIPTILKKIKDFKIIV